MPVVAWLLAIGWHLVANQVIARVGQRVMRNGHPSRAQPLTDIMHDVLPYVHIDTVWKRVGFESVSMLPIATCVAVGSWVAFLRLHTIVLVLRPVCFCGTLLPDASGKGARAPQPHWASMTGGVHDLMFSGHVSASLLAIGAMALDGTAGPWLILALVCLAAVQSLLILATHKHYTVDVVVAWIVCGGFVHGWQYENRTCNW